MADLQQPEGDDFVIATGVQHSVRDFVVAAARELGITIEWKGEGAREEGLDAGTGKTIVKVDPRYFRPAEVETLLGDASKARAKLGWQPKTSFSGLVSEMIREELTLAKYEAVCKTEGLRVLDRHE